MLADPVSEFPYRAFIVTCIVLVFGAGWLGSYATERMRDTAHAEAKEGLKDAKPVVQKAPWYSGDCREVARTCQARERLSKVKGTKT